MTAADAAVKMLELKGGTQTFDLPHRLRRHRAA